MLRLLWEQEVPDSLAADGFRMGSKDQRLLIASGICKSFAGVRALHGVSFDLAAGEVHALVGENGAGKSTLIKIIAGAEQPDAGTLLVDSQALVEHDPTQARRLGIAAIYQQPALFPDLTVAENIAFGLEPGGNWRRVRWPERRRRAKELLDRVGATIDPGALVQNLSMPEQQLVEMARALGAEARVLIMDEPTAALSEREVERLQGVIRDLRRNGVGIIYISHRLEEVFEVADRVTVLRDGAAVCTRPIGELNRSELIRLMVGRELSAIFPKQQVAIGEPVLELRGVCCAASGIRDIDLTVRAGEIVGLAGLVGAGRTELAGVLFGITPASAGEIRLRGKAVQIDSPAAAVRLGLAYVPEDRRHHGVIPELPLTANATLAILSEVSQLGWLNFAAERRVTQSFVERLGIKTASVAAPVGTLSGGNQQKVAVARWLATEPAVLILDEPTQGVDVGAKAEIHRLMGELAGRGMAILMISSELPEILGMSDRIYALHAGRISGCLARQEATQEKILAMALGHTAIGPTQP